MPILDKVYDRDTVYTHCDINFYIYAFHSVQDSTISDLTLNSNSYSASILAEPTIAHHYTSF